MRSGVPNIYPAAFQMELMDSSKSIHKQGNGCPPSVRTCHFLCCRFHIGAAEGQKWVSGVNPQPKGISFHLFVCQWIIFFSFSIFCIFCVLFVSHIFHDSRGLGRPRTNICSGGHVALSATTTNTPPPASGAPRLTRNKIS